MIIRANVGTGPGPITPDGCAVAFYTLLPPAGEAEIVHAALPPAASVLELGCGTGRILRRLAELGHPVLGIDESPDMLDQAADLDTVCSSIETLDLHRAFDAVLLVGTLINTPDPAARAAMLDTARRHTIDSGSVVIQRHPPQWFDTLVPSSVERDDIHYTIGSVDRDGLLLTTTIQYQVEDRRWTHTFTARCHPTTSSPRPSTTPASDTSAGSPQITPGSPQPPLDLQKPSGHARQPRPNGQPRRHPLQLVSSHTEDLNPTRASSHATTRPNITKHY